MDLSHAPDFRLLLERLSDAERALARFAGPADRVMEPGSLTDLLREAREALISRQALADENAAALEARVRLAEAELVASDRMAAIGILAAGVAHEINNPLASLVANLELALEDLADAAVAPFDRERCRLVLCDAREGAERIRQIVRDIKLFSREKDCVRPIHVERVLESTLRMAWNEIHHRARLIRQYEAVPPVQGNESRLGQVYLNLLINAAQAIPEGRALEHSIRVSISSDGDYVSVVISDTGEGIAPEARARLFTPFFTSKSSSGGTGLGLSICKRIVEEMGGDISLESELGLGTNVRVRLPVAEAGAERRSSRPPPLAGSRRGGRVLVIDDDRLLGKSLVRAFEHHEVAAVASAREALELLTAGSRFDVIFCDLMMPDMTGKDFFAEVEAAFPAHARRTVFITAGALTEKLQEFLKSVPARHLEKPLDLRTLAAVIDDYLE